MPGRPRRFSWPHGEGWHGAAMKPEVYGIPIDRAKACAFDGALFDRIEAALLRCGPRHRLAEVIAWGATWGPDAALREAQLARGADYTKRALDGRLAYFGQLDTPRGDWTYIAPEEVQILKKKDGCWQDRSGKFVVWNMHVHDTVGVPLRLARALYGKETGLGLGSDHQPNDQEWLDAEIKAGRLVCEGELVRQPPPSFLPDWPHAETPGVVLVASCETPAPVAELPSEAASDSPIKHVYARGKEQELLEWLVNIGIEDRKQGQVRTMPQWTKLATDRLPGLSADRFRRKLWKQFKAKAETAGVPMLGKGRPRAVIEDVARAPARLKVVRGGGDCR